MTEAAVAEIAETDVAEYVYRKRTGGSVSPNSIVVLKYICDETCRTGVQPKPRDIADRFGISVNSAVYSIKNLVRYGYLGELECREGEVRRHGYRLLHKPDGTPFVGFEAL